ncbi:hypothetical protein BGW36DRAFT_421607 [Talaromyces proteolyticus]|uniref:Ecp2 effector protein domain-containing protein n=1 Tax=Talaromyces proteolyticus TaxID=1131652 RepID=A0AAD4L1S3_9EURO|nr:uncharacterized protein BGW36DRAFT_421607 [Talaromyces proteolyticus]KAH8705030.1 hypothetical protein BGW36DRAFT_421607 [Talaromyces proteolyticus]
MCEKILQHLWVVLAAITVIASPIKDRAVQATKANKLNYVPVSNIRHVDQGELSCLSDNNFNEQGDPNWFMSYNGATQLANASCGSWQAYGIPMDYSPGVMVYSHTPHDAFMSINDSTDPQYTRAQVTFAYIGGPNCPDLDKLGIGIYPVCKERLATIINYCDTGRNDNLWKQGGRFFRDCMVWSIWKMPVSPT